jgi:uncharacterized protein YciI
MLQLQEDRSFMQFILIAHDKAGALPLRMATRPAHLVYMAREIGPKLRFAGPLLDEAGNPNGSVVVVEVADEAEAKGLFDGDPYMGAGLFADFTISRFRHVFSDGVQI